MRLLFTTWAWRSHLYAMTPLAWACRAAGHEVLVASQPALAGEIVRTGLPAVAVGHDVDAVALVREYLLPVGGAAEPTRRARGAGPRVLAMLLAHAESMAGDLTELARRWKADLVVFEPTTLAGPIAAGAAGVPAVRHLYGVDLLSRAASLLPGLLAPLAGKHDAGEIDPLGAVTIDPVPAALRMPSDRPSLPMRYLPYNGPGAVTAPPEGSASAPRVCVTWGHTIAKVAPDRFPVASVVTALARTGVEVIVAISAEQRPLLGEVPPGVRVVLDRPLHNLLPHCDLVVAHGGAGSILTTLSHGLPQLLVPQLPDHAGHAGRVLAAGAGEVLMIDEATPERLCAETARLLGEGGARAAAERVRAEMLSSPAPAELVGELAALAR